MRLLPRSGGPWRVAAERCERAAETQALERRVAEQTAGVSQGKCGQRAGHGIARKSSTPDTHDTHGTPVLHDAPTRWTALLHAR